MQVSHRGNRQIIVIDDLAERGRGWVVPSLLLESRMRWHSPYINHFISADTVVASYANPQSLNRYSYVLNNPVKLTDPTGHRACGDGEDADCSGHKQDPNQNPYAPKPKPHKESKSNNPAVSLLRNASTILDTAAWAIDLYDAGVVVAGGIFGAGVGLPFTEGGPEVPAVTGLAGMGIAELYVQAPMKVANILSTVSTGLTAVADVLAGDTNLKNGAIGKNTLNSVTTTAFGWSDPEAITGFAAQSLGVSNDLGWSSFPLKEQTRMNLNWLFPSLILISSIFLVIGVYLIFKIIRVDRKISKGEGISLRDYWVGSALTGACVFLISVGGILAAGSVSALYGEGWTVYEIMEIAILISIVVILAVLGSLWRYFIVGKFRTLLYQKLKDQFKK